MALGGGVFTTQNKTFPGAYINFISASKASATLSDRGVAAMPLELSWGVDGEVFAVDSADFQKNSLKIFGFDYTHEKMRGLRDLFLNAKKGYFYKLNSGGEKASNKFATALYTGSRGNDITIVIEPNEMYSDADKIYDVSVLFDGVKSDVQTVKTAAELTANGYVSFDASAELEFTAGMPLAGGTDGAAVNSAYQDFIDKIESFSFNTLGCLSTESTVKSLFASFTKRMRDEVGVKFQCVLHKYSQADFEGVVSVENNAESGLVYWVTGALAGCEVNASCTNKVYNGETPADTNYTQAQLEKGLKSGQFLLHRVGDKVRVLEDINTFVSFSDSKSADFASNQTMRVLDQIGNDIATLFSGKYLGQVPNDKAGRVSFWNDIVSFHQKLQSIRAIEEFNPEDIVVSQGDSKKSVAVSQRITPVNAMAQLYLTCIVA